MSRAIRFRAWDKKNECMVTVLEMRLLFEDTLAVMVEGACDCNDGVLQTHENHKHAIFPEDLELMQFTGMADCDDIEIYEGDIIEHDFKPCGMQRDEVVFEDNCFCLQYGNKYMPSKHERKVIGNIYENRELLAV